MPPCLSYPIKFWESLYRILGRTQKCRVKTKKTWTFPGLTLQIICISFSAIPKAVSIWDILRCFRWFVSIFLFTVTLKMFSVHHFRIVWNHLNKGECPECLMGGCLRGVVRAPWSISCISPRARNIGIHILPNPLYSLLMVLTRRICWKIRSFLNWW